MMRTAVLRRWAGSTFVVLAAVAGAGHWPSHAQTPAAPVISGRWTGTASGEMKRVGIGNYTLPREGTEPGGAANQSGTVVTTWTATLQLKEGQPVDVKDPSGVTVGRLVPLVDDGSTVLMSVTGRMSERNPYGDIEHWDYSGRGATPESSALAAGGGAFANGWVYRRLSDQDPLADVLPDGAYSLAAQPTVLNLFSVKVTSIDAGHASEPHVSTMPTGGRGSWMAGWFMWAWSTLTPAQRAGMGFGDNGMSITTDSLRRTLTAAEPVMKTISDANPRSFVVRDGSMNGSLVQREMVSLDERTSLASEWHLERRLSFNSTLTRAGRDWRPTKDGLVTVRASLDPAQGLTGKFRFKLFDVSRETGYAINAGTGNDPDLEFAQGQDAFMGITTQRDSWTIETVGTSASAQVVLVATDYGAFGRISAQVNVDGHWYDCDAEGGGTTITLPRDDNNNRIADGWEEEHRVLGKPATDDRDDYPAPTDPADVEARRGDGLTNYEEYRGFLQNTEWVGGNPDQKDLFIFDELGLGVGFIGKTELTIHLIVQDEYDSERVVNFNSKSGFGTSGPQKGLYLAEKHIEGDFAGQAFPEVGTPNTMQWIGLDSTHTNFPFVGGYFDAFVGHELGHGVNMPHHGDLPVTNRICPGSPSYIAVRGGQYSGEWRCVMRYNEALYYEGWDGRCYEAPSEGLVNMYCTSKAGTELNAGPNRIENGMALPMAGDATVGACLNHLTIRGTATIGGR